MIKQTTIEKIKKYTKLRGATDPRLREDILIDVYQNASNKERVLYNQEMDRYIEAVETGKLEPGQPFIITTLKS